jgi:hypothetical protein
MHCLHFVHQLLLATFYHSLGSNDQLACSPVSFAATTDLLAMEQDVPQQQQQQQQEQQQYMQHSTATTAAAPGLETVSVDISAVKINITRKREWQPGAV